MATLKMTDANFSEFVNENELVVIDIWAEWCAPCKRFSPIYEKISAKYPNIAFTKVDADENAIILEYFSIRAIPSILVIKNKQLILNHPGFVSESGMEEIVNKAISYISNVDMSEGDSGR